MHRLSKVHNIKWIEPRDIITSQNFLAERLAVSLFESILVSTSHDFELENSKAAIGTYLHPLVILLLSYV